MKKTLLVFLAVACFTVVKLQAQTAFENFAQGQAAVSEGKLSLAVSLFEKAVRETPSNAVYRNWLGSVLYDTGDYDGAIKHLEKAAEIGDVWCYYWGMSYLKKGNVSKAAEIFRKGIPAERKTVRKKEMETLLVNMAKYQEKIAAAEACVATEDYSKAASRYREALEIIQTESAKYSLVQAEAVVHRKQAIVAVIVLIVILIVLCLLYVSYKRKTISLVGEIEKSVNDTEKALVLFAKYKNRYFSDVKKLQKLSPETLYKLYAYKGKLESISSDIGKESEDIEYKKELLPVLIKNKEYKVARNIIIESIPSYPMASVFRICEGLNDYSDIRRPQVLPEWRIACADYLMKCKKTDEAIKMLDSRFLETILKNIKAFSGKHFETLSIIVDVYDANGKLEELVLDILKDKIILSENATALTRKLMTIGKYEMSFQVMKLKAGNGGFEKLNENEWNIFVDICAKLGMLECVSPLAPAAVIDKAVAAMESKGENNKIRELLLQIPKKRKEQWLQLLDAHIKLDELQAFPLDAPDYAINWVLEELEGKKAFMALKQYIEQLPKITPEQWDKYFVACSALKQLGAIPPTAPAPIISKALEQLEKDKDTVSLLSLLSKITKNDEQWHKYLALKEKAGEWKDLVSPKEIPAKYHKNIQRMLFDHKKYKELIAFMAKADAWSPDEYLTWFEVCLLERMSDSAVKPLAELENKPGGANVLKTYFAYAKRLEGENRQKDALLIYRKFVNEKVFFEDVLERYISLSGGSRVFSGSSGNKGDSSVKAPKTPESLRSPDETQTSGGDELIGKKYEFVREIGRGGMGVVYEALNREINKKVAIKKMKDELAINPREKKRFLEEATRVAELNHPNIVAIYDRIEESGCIYLVFEYVDGETIDGILDRKGKCTLKETKKVMLAASSALEYAHGKKIIHRDIKPSNIMLSKEGWIKVMDFGIAREIKDTLSRLTGTDNSGTRAYMSPEQHLGTGFDARSDIYSLGVTMYEMLAGETPFKGPDFYLQKQMMAYCKLREICPELPENVEETITRCLQFDKHKRYKSAGELIEAIEGLKA